MPDTTKPSGVTTQLSIMMFLELFVWGSWYVTMSPFMDSLGMDGDTIGLAYSAGPIAAIISPFFLGLIADRFFAAEKVLVTLHLLGGAALFAAPYAAQSSSTAFIAVIFVHMLCFMPTLGLTNTIAFHNITNSEKQFPLIRVFGTLGWIAANLAISALDFDTSANMFYLAGGSALALGLFSFALPHTPPPSKGKAFSARDALGLDALKLLAKPSFAIFALCSFLLCIPLAAYYGFAGLFVGESGFENIALNMSFGQMSEVFFMVVMPVFFARLGVKWMLIVGMAAWVLRYSLFASAADESIRWMVLSGILLHGICYDFFFVTGQIYVDKAANPKIRGAAQGFLVLITQGLGMFLGALAAGRLVSLNTRGHLLDGNGNPIEGVGVQSDSIPAGSELLLRDGSWVVQGSDKALIDGITLTQDVYASGAHIEDRIDWQTVWTYPAVFAGIIMVVFFVFFRNEKFDAAQSESDSAHPSDDSP